jgi:hypothetical protein
MKVLIVAGMHRSGTSLAANWLDRCGLYEGEELGRSAVANPVGQFEDEDFVAFHESLLRRNGWKSALVGGEAPLKTAPEDRDAGLELIGTRKTHAQWGWKDPRTTLFLAFWKTLVPELKTLAVYREPAAVVDSLLRRRRARVERKRPASLASGEGALWLAKRSRVGLRRSWLNPAAVRSYADVWRRYNAELIRFAGRHPDDLLLVRVDHLRKRSLAIVDALNRHWGFELRGAPIEEVFDADLLRAADRTSRRATLVRRLCPAVAGVERELAALEHRSHERLGLSTG